MRIIAMRSLKSMNLRNLVSTEKLMSDSNACEFHDHCQIRENRMVS